MSKPQPMQADSALAIAAERMLRELRSNTLICQRVMRYLSLKDQKRLAGRMARAVMKAALEAAVLNLRLTDRDFAVEALNIESARMAGFREPPVVRWCLHCNGQRWSRYANVAHRCTECGHATVALEKAPEQQEQPASTHFQTRKRA